MAISFTVSFNSSYKKLTIDISSLDGSENLYLKKSTDEDYTLYLSSVTATAYTLIYDGGAIQQGSTGVDIFDDALYYIKVATSATATGEVMKILSVGAANKCLSSKISELAQYDYESRCNLDLARDELFLMYMMLQGAIYNATEECGNYTKATSQLSFIGEYCNLSLDCTSTECC